MLELIGKLWVGLQIHPTGQHRIHRRVEIGPRSFQPSAAVIVNPAAVGALGLTDQLLRLARFRRRSRPAPAPTMETGGSGAERQSQARWLVGRPGRSACLLLRAARQQHNWQARNRRIHRRNRLALHPLAFFIDTLVPPNRLRPQHRLSIALIPCRAGSRSHSAQSVRLALLIVRRFANAVGTSRPRPPARPRHSGSIDD